MTRTTIAVVTYIMVATAAPMVIAGAHETLDSRAVQPQVGTVQLFEDA